MVLFLLKSQTGVVRKLEKSKFQALVGWVIILHLEVSGEIEDYCMLALPVATAKPASIFGRNIDSQFDLVVHEGSFRLS